MNFREQFKSHLLKKYPPLTAYDLNSYVAENMFCDEVIEIPLTTARKISEFIKTVFALREDKSYQNQTMAKVGPIPDPKNKSILMSYDFHLDTDQNPKLIEVNTNAAFLGLGLEMYETKNQPLPIANYSFNVLKENILQEYKLFSGFDLQKLSIAILDEKPEQQRLFLEFLVFNEVFKSWGFESEIIDIAAVSEKFQFIYNRYTDFFLKEEASQKILNLWKDQKVCLSPNPFEYALLADKERMTEWSQISNPIFAEVIPKCHLLNKENADEIWTSRKKYFFKPLRSFGSKQSYRGGTISRNTYDQIVPQDFIAQEFIPPSVVKVKTDSGLQEMKMDLRCYAYQNELQFMVARVYQGQVTNMRTPYGGFACVRLTTV